MIRTLLFDLGGVIMDIRRQNCVKAFADLGLKNADTYFGDYAQEGIFMAIEDGSASVEQFHDTLRRLLPEGTPDTKIDEAFCRFLIGIPLHRLRALDSLKDRFRICLLSNTNPIMWNSRIDEAFRIDGRTREDYFDGMVTSFAAKSAKPDAEIFRYAIRTLGLVPEETLFLDDSQANLDAAAALGFHTALVAPGTEFTDCIPQ